MINIVFFGLPELEDVLSLDEPLKQRVAVKIGLKEFSEKDTRDYIKHRLSVAGSTREIFSEEAYGKYSRARTGIPGSSIPFATMPSLKGTSPKQKP